MVKRIVFLLVGWMACGLAAQAQIPVFINEIHYDNNGADVGEGIEIAGPAGTNLACFRLYYYNGTTTPGAAVLYDSLVLSGVIPNQCNGFGVINFPLTLPSSLQNGANDGIALVFNPLFAGCATPGIPGVVQFLSYEGTITAGNGPAIGRTSTDVGVFETSTSAIGLSLQLAGAGVLYTDFNWAPSATATPGAVNNGQTFGGTSCGTGPVIASELRFRGTPTGCNIPGSPLSFQVCATNAAGFTDITFNSAITLSLVSGPGVLSGTTTQTAVFGCASFTGLTLSAPGAYVFRATNGVWSDTSVTVYISASCANCPNMNAVLVDACGSQEGRNEIVFFNSGDYAIPVNTTSWSFTYGTANPPTVGYTNSLTSNQSYINSLNTMAGCNIFVDAMTNSPIPPNTNFLVMNYLPQTVYNFSAWCSLGSVYVIFSNDPDWDTTGGNFKNCIDCAPTQAGTTPRYFRTNFSGLNGGAGCDFTYNYTPCSDLACTGNGDGLDFGYGGGTPTANWSECTPQGVLAVNYAMALRGYRDGPDVRLNWETSMEANSSHFIVERSAHPTGPFENVGTLPAAGNSSTTRTYAYRDAQAPATTLWYRLQELDMNGTATLSSVTEVSPSTAVPSIHTSVQGSTYTFDAQSAATLRVELIAATGQTLATAEGSAGLVRMDLGHLPAGVYLYRATVGDRRVAGKLQLNR